MNPVYSPNYSDQVKLGLSDGLLISLVFLPKILFRQQSRSRHQIFLNLAELVKKELMKCIFKKFTNVPFSIQFIVV